MNPATQHVRRVLTRKRHVVRDSITVVRHCARALVHNRFLLRLMAGVIVSAVAALVSWRSLGAPVGKNGRTLTHAAVVAARLVVTLSLQFVVASWLWRTWRGDAPSRVRHLWRHLATRLPAFVVCAALLAWLDHSASLTSAAAFLRAVVSFVFTYALSYAVPASAVYGSGMLKGFGHAYRSWRATFGADILAFAGVWMVTGLMSLVSAIPDALDLYTPQSDGERLSRAGRVVNWLVVMPSAITAVAVSAAFTTVILYALNNNRAPGSFPLHPVETVSGLELEA